MDHNFGEEVLAYKGKWTAREAHLPEKLANSNTFKLFLKSQHLEHMLNV